MLVGLVPGITVNADALDGIAGLGESWSPYELNGASEVKVLADYINSNDTTDIYVTVKKDIDASDLSDFKGFGSESHPFNGHFDGNGYTITVNISGNGKYSGLFPYIGEEGTVQGVTLVGNVTETTDSGNDFFVGGIAGENKGEITGCTNTATVSARYADGDYTILAGIAGYNYGTIQGCRNMGVVGATDDLNDGVLPTLAAAGITGANYGESSQKPAQVLNCENIRAVSAPSGCAGIAIAANKFTTIKDCKNSGEITSRNNVAAGIICEARTDGNGVIESCTNTANVTAGGKTAGGIAASIYNTDISKCSNSGAVTGNWENDGNRIGGIVGDAASGNIYMSDNTGTVTANSKIGSSVGGIAGEFGYTDQSFVIDSCYNAGEVICEGIGYVGGIVGINYGSNIYNIYNVGTISAKGEQRHATITDDDGNVSETEDVLDGITRVGGIAGGIMPRNSNAPFIKFAYNAGELTITNEKGTNSAVGGIVGVNETDSAGKIKGRYESCYYENDRAESADGEGDKTGELTPEEMLLEESYEGWDFHFTWEIIEDLPKFNVSGRYSGSPIILNKGDLEIIAQGVQNGNTYIGKYFATNDSIELGDDWMPIGSAGAPFMGTFDGKGHTVKFSIRTGGKYNGLFGYIGSRGKARNITTGGSIEITLNEASYTGVIAGFNEGTVEGCEAKTKITVTGNTSDTIYVGGLVGYNNGGTLSRNSVGGSGADILTVTSDNGTLYAGGIVGCNILEGVVKDNYSLMDVRANGGGTVTGLLAGTNSDNSPIENCFQYYSGYTAPKNMVSEGGPYISCYYFSETRGSDGAITSADFKEKSTFAGWDFTNVWKMGSKYPILKELKEEQTTVEIELNGQGTQDNPYQITSAEDLKTLQVYVNEAKQPATGLYFKLMSSIDLGGNLRNEWTPIGNSSGCSFEGYFDGGGHTISGLYINNIGKEFEYAGLFGGIKDARISNLTVEGEIHIEFLVGETSDATRKIGAIAANAENSEITHCTNRVDITVRNIYSGEYISGAHSHIGGIVGAAGDNEPSLVNDCVNTGTIRVGGEVNYVASNGYRVGGIAGSAREVRRCVNSGLLDLVGVEAAGGIVGSTDFSALGDSRGGVTHVFGEIWDCENRGEIKVESAIFSSTFLVYYGGIMGYGDAVHRCTNNGNITITPTPNEEDYMGWFVFNAGGIAGALLYSDRCLNNGDIDVTLAAHARTTGLYVGGITGVRSTPISTNTMRKRDVGYNAVISNSCNLGNITLSGSYDDTRRNEAYVGGLFGYYMSSQSSHHPLGAKNSYSYSTIKTNDFYSDVTVDGVGTFEDKDDSVEKSYCVNSKTKCRGAENRGSMGSLSSYVSEDWDLEYVWETGSGSMKPKTGGTLEDPFEITDYDDLAAFAKSVNNDAGFSGTYFKLMNDLDVDGNETMIGVDSHIFHGAFDGNGHTINLTGDIGQIKGSDDQYFGLFGACGYYSEINNLNINADINIENHNKGNSYVGMVAGYTYGIIYNCNVEFKCHYSNNNTGYIGGIAGHAVSVTNCVAGGSIWFDADSKDYYLGGIAGTIDERAAHCVSNIDIDASGNSVVGGIVGVGTDITVSECYHTGNLYSEFSVGGIVGRALGDSQVYDCFNEGEINVGASSDKSVFRQGGGIVGEAFGTAIDNCYSYGSMSTLSPDGRCYGVFGLYSTSDNPVEGSPKPSEWPRTEAKNSFYSSKGVDATYREDVYSVASNCRNLTDADFANQDTFIAWDFDSVWTMDETKGRPVLRNVGNAENTLVLLDGSGTEDNPYQIPSRAAFMVMKGYIDEGNSTLGLYFKITNDIDLGGVTSEGEPLSAGRITPIGTPIGSSEQTNYVFDGVLDGGGHTLSGLYIDGSASQRAGLFAQISASGEVKNLTIDNSVVKASTLGSSGMFSGICGGTISNCINKGTVSTNAGSTLNLVGGIAGRVSEGGVIEECGNEGTVSGYTAGGIAGSFNGSKIANLYNTGEISGTNAAGIVSILGGVQPDLPLVVYNIGKVSGTSTGMQIVNTDTASVPIIAYLPSSSSDGAAPNGTNITVNEFSEEDFSSGLMAHMLNDLTETDYVWRQRLSAENSHPTFTVDDGAKVYKITFMKDEQQEDGSYAKAVYHEEYVNADDEIEYPETPTDMQYKFKWWTADTQAMSEFEPPVTGDLTLYAVGEEMYGSSGKLGDFDTTYSTEGRFDLSPLVAFAPPRDGEIDSTAEKFKYAILDNGGCSGAYIIGDELVVPAGTNAGRYQFKIDASEAVSEDDLVLFSLPNVFDVEPITLDVTVTVKKCEQMLEAPRMQGNSAMTLRLVPVTAHGDVTYAIMSERDYMAHSANIVWQDSNVFTKLTPGTTYYAWVQASGDENYDSGISPVGMVYTSEHTHSWEYSFDGNTVSARCTAPECPNRDGGIYTMSAPQEDIVYDGQPHPPVITDTLATDDVPTVTYHYRPFGADDYTVAAAPIDAGDYRVTSTVASYSMEVEYSISKAHSTSFEPTLFEQTYYGSTLADMELPAGYTWDGDSSESVGSIGVHTFTATYTPSSTTNYYVEQANVIVEVLQKPENIISADDVEIDYINEQLTGFESGNYLIICGDDAYTATVGTDGAIGIKERCIGQDVEIIKLGRNNNYTVSERITVSIPDKSAAPEGLETIKADDIDSLTGEIYGVNDTMEYFSLETKEWVSVESGADSITGLAPGAYYIRVKGSETSFPGRIARVVVGVKSQIIATFIDGNDNILKTEILPDSSTPTYDMGTDPVPTKESTAQYDYTFTGWDKDIDMPIGMDTIYTAQFESIPRSYTVKWIVTGSVKKTETYNYGEMPDYGSEPERGDNDRYSYKFSGWTPEVGEVKSNAVYAAVFDRIPKTYKVTLNTNGGEIPGSYKTEYTFGEGLKLPVPIRENYDFLGWYDGNGSRFTEIGVIATGDKEFNARWKRVRELETIIDPNEIVIGYENETLGGFESGKYLVVCGAQSELVDVSDGTIPIDEDCFGQTVYITRIARDENHLNSTRIAFAVPARPEMTGSIAAKKATSIDAADGQITGLSDDMEYRSINDTEWILVKAGETTADNLSVGIYYVRRKASDSAFASEAATVAVGVEGYALAVFVDGDGKAVAIKHILDGTAPGYADTDPVPTKESTAQYEYTFAGWDKNPDEPISETTIYTAQFDSVLRSYKITWIVNGGTREETYLYGTMPSYGSIPERESTENHSYEFADWYPSIMTVSRDQTYIAVFDETARRYNVTLDPNGGTLAPGSDITSYTCGESRNLPTANEITKDGCDFLGWYDEAGNQVTRIASDEIGDKTYTAHWDTTVTKEEIISESDVVTDYEAETLGNFEDGDYLIVLENLSLSVTVTNGTIPIKEIYFGRDIQIIKKASDGYHTDSDPITVSVKERPAAPDGITVNRASDDNSADGAIIGVTSDMEYRRAKTDEWLPIESGQTLIDGLEPGIYYVRIKQSGEEFHGRSKIVVVGIADKVAAAFIDGDDNLLYAEYIALGSVPEYQGETPTKSENDAYRYEFSGWDKDITQPLTVDTIFMAQFAEIPRTYGVILNPNGGTIADGYDITEYTYGDAVKLPDAAHVTRDGFDFAGWYDGNGRLMTEIPQYSVGDVEYTADWTASTDKPDVPPTPTHRPSSGGGGGGGGGSLGTDNATPTPEPTPTPEETNAPDTTVPQNPVTTAIFEDVPAEHWAYSYIMDLYNTGIINGKTDTLFVPNDNVTRAEFAKMAAMLFGLTAQSENSQFADVTADDWYAPYVIAATEAGIVNGTSETTFSPNDNITREQIAAIIGRQMGWTSENAAAYSDADSIAAYALPYVNGLTEQGILTGNDGMFRPKDNSTRAEAAAIVDRVKNH